MKKFKLILKIIITMPFLCVLFPVVVYYDVSRGKIPKWVDRVGNKWGDFLKVEER